MTHSNCQPDKWTVCNYATIYYVINLIKYWIIATETKNDQKAFIEIIQQGLSIPIKEELMTMAEQLIQQGIQLGIQAVQRGIQQGMTTFLLRLLKQKFIIIPESYQQKIEQANTDMLLTWGDRILDAKSLEEIFKD